MPASELSRALRAHADPAIAAHSTGFFRAIPGGYGEGDRFLGIRVPVVRKVARQGRRMPLGEVLELLRSPWHEERLMALVIMVEQFKRGDDGVRGGLHTAYLDHTVHVNNWDLVDISAPHLVGRWLLTRDRGVLRRLAGSSSMWEQRIGMLATFAFIREGQFDDALAMADLLIDHEHDLIHKAVGWMLREVGNRDLAVEEAFLRPRYRSMPRTMLRYAIEKFPEELRLGYLRGEIAER